MKCRSPHRPKRWLDTLPKGSKSNACAGISSSSTCSPFAEIAPMQILLAGHCTSAPTASRSIPNMPASLLTGFAQPSTIALPGRLSIVRFPAMEGIEMRVTARATGHAQANSQKLRRSMLMLTKEGGRLHTQPILRNGCWYLNLRENSSAGRPACGQCHRCRIWRHCTDKPPIPHAGPRRTVCAVRHSASLQVSHVEAIQCPSSH